MRKGSREDGKKKKKKVKSWGTSSSDKEKFLKKKFRGWQNHSAFPIWLEQALSLKTMWVPVQWLLTTHNRVSIGGIFCFCLRCTTYYVNSSTITSTRSDTVPTFL